MALNTVFVTPQHERRSNFCKPGQREKIRTRVASTIYLDMSKFSKCGQKWATSNTTSAVLAPVSKPCPEVNASMLSSSGSNPQKWIVLINEPDWTQFRNETKRQNFDASQYQPLDALLFFGIKHISINIFQVTINKFIKLNLIWLDHFLVLFSLGRFTHCRIKPTNIQHWQPLTNGSEVNIITNRNLFRTSEEWTSEWWRWKTEIVQFAEFPLSYFLQFHLPKSWEI